jgi:prepilin-type N-terminal cleavage/methylation domain-containing protein
MSKSKQMGFTLIELMVVIVIIGVLASLAIPRFTEASDKAKVAEAPRVLASYESAQLAHLAEQNYFGSSADIIFDITAIQSESKWFSYNMNATTGETATASATAPIKIGKIAAGNGIITTLSNAGTSFHAAISDKTTVQKYLPNWFRASNGE